MIPAGRDKRAAFADLFAKSMRARVVMSPAFSNLTSSAKSMCFIVFVKIDNAKFHKRKHDDGRPIITFSASEAKALLGISGVTHTAAMRQLVGHGFLEQIGHGGLLGANGTASTYVPAKHWQTWKPENAKRDTGNIRKALQAKQARKKRTEPKAKPTKPPLQVSGCNSLQAGNVVYYYPDESRLRARKGTLLVELPDGWQIQGKRHQSAYHAPVITVPHDLILSEEQLKTDRRNRSNYYRKEGRKHAA